MNWKFSDYEAPDGQLVKTLDLTSEETGLFGLTATQAGNMVGYFSEEGLVLKDTQTGEDLITLATLPFMGSLSFSPEGSLLWFQGLTITDATAEPQWAYLLFDTEKGALVIEHYQPLASESELEILGGFTLIGNRLVARLNPRNSKIELWGIPR